MQVWMFKMSLTWTIYFVYYLSCVVIWLTEQTKSENLPIMKIVLTQERYLSLVGL